MAKKIAAARPVRADDPDRDANNARVTSGTPRIAGDFTPTFSAELHIGTALRETFRAFARAVAANQQPIGLSLSMWFALRTLWEEDGLSQVELARRMEVAPAAVVGVVNALEAAGYVERRRKTQDKRIFNLHVTAAGKDLRKDATARALQVDAKALRGVGADEILQVLDVLTRLRRNLAAEK